MLEHSDNSIEPTHFQPPAGLEHPIWWQDICTNRCILTRRHPQDAVFLRQLWKTPGFMQDFHPLAASLPESDTDLKAILQREYESLPLKSRGLHWIVRTPDRTPWGLLSLCDIALPHRRAEIMLGTLPGRPFALPVAAMLMAFIFFFKSIKFHKLCSLVFSDNMHSLHGTLSLGFREEGRLISHAYDPRANAYRDIHQFGIHEEEAFSIKNQRLMKKLLG